MSKREKILLKLLSGNADNNFSLDDLVGILTTLGFEERRSLGSHRIFTKKNVAGIINLQKSKDGKAKPYQVKQVREFLITNKIISE
jgi:predicted RNA binding protein YcfA (HicA-like mRNA interferase family)